MIILYNVCKISILGFQIKIKTILSEFDEDEREGRDKKLNHIMLKH